MEVWERVTLFENTISICGVEFRGVIGNVEEFAFEDIAVVFPCAVSIVGNPRGVWICWIAIR